MKTAKREYVCIDETNKSFIHCKALKCREHGEKGPLPVGGHLEKMKKFGNCPIQKSRRVRAFYAYNVFFKTAIFGQTGSQKTKWPMPNDSPTDGLSKSALKKKWAEPNKKCLREGKWELRGKDSLYEQLTERIFQIGEGVLEISKNHEKGVILYGRYSKSLTYRPQIFSSFRNWLTMTNGKRIFQIEETVFEISLNMG